MGNGRVVVDEPVRFVEGLEEVLLGFGRGRRGVLPGEEADVDPGVGCRQLVAILDNFGELVLECFEDLDCPAPAAVVAEALDGGRCRGPVAEGEEESPV